MLYRYFRSSSTQTLSLEVVGAGCGVGEWLGEYPANSIDYFPSQVVGSSERNVSKCICGIGYYRDVIGWCSQCVVGGICDTINTKIETMRSQRGWWRNESDDGNFSKCEGSNVHTACVSGWKHNGTQCQEGHTGVLCGICEPSMERWETFENIDAAGNNTNMSNDNGSYSHNSSNHNSSHIVRRSFVRTWKRRDRSSFIVSKPDMCVSCVFEVDENSVDHSVYRSLLMWMLILIGFVLLVFFVLIKPINDTGTSRTSMHSLKIVPEENDGAASLRRARSSSSSSSSLLLFDQEELQTRFRITRQRLWVLIEHFQVLSHLSITYAVNWPASFRDFFQMFYFVNGDIWSIVTGSDICILVSSFYEAMHIHTLTPIIITVTACLAWGVVALVGLLKEMNIGSLGCCCAKSCCLRYFNYEDRSAAWRRVLALSFDVGRLMTPGIVSRLMRVWQCTEVNGKFFMLADLREECHSASSSSSSSSWSDASKFSVACLVLYVGILPMFQIFLLRRRAAKEKDGWTSHKCVEAHGALYLHLRPTFYSWWEAVSIVQRSCLSGFFMVIVPGSSAQLMLATLLSLLWLSLSLRIQPHHEKWVSVFTSYFYFFF